MYKSVVYKQDIVTSVFTVRSLVKTEGNNQAKLVVSPIKVESGVAKLPLSTRVPLQVNNQEDHCKTDILPNAS